ncbi:Protein FAM107A [Channa argus]|uniref:Protein FAM107A n=1 Tax=Channa argus TaxID=215402 RepID=A0A6G1Q4F0_CHAAH|nr:Protein FAM107A [Channa argus]
MANLLRQKSFMNDQYTTDIGVNAETCSNESNPVMKFTSHNKLHKELLLAHKRICVKSVAFGHKLIRPGHKRFHTFNMQLYKYSNLYRGQALSSRSELQEVLERRKRVQSDQEEEEQTRTPLEDALVRHQQKQLERRKEHEEKIQKEDQLMEFVRVRQNLRKIHSVVHNKAASAN